MWPVNYLMERVTSLVVWEKLGVKLLRIERNQLRWLVQLVRMPLGALLETYLRHAQPGGGPGVDQRHSGWAMSAGWPGNTFGCPW